MALDRSTASERLNAAALLVGTGGETARRRLLSCIAWLQVPPRRPPARLLIAPQDIRTADPTVAGDIYSGYWAFGGKVLDTHGRSPFDLAPPSDDWAAALHGFAWLRHLRAADTALARANGRALVEDWIAWRGRNGREVAWRPAVVARRILAWLSQSPIILEGADGRTYRRLMRSLARQATFLRRQLAGGLRGEARLLATLALAEYSICAEASPKALRQGARGLIDELNRQILPDGGHVSRNPAVLIELLLDLLPLRQAFAARGAEVPPHLLNAIDRMLPMLRMFRHPDGAVALFNGMGVASPEALATVLAYDDVRAMPSTNAPYAGYQRLDAGDAVLICDAGPPPPATFARQAHAGTLSFEFSAGPCRVIVNCGTPSPLRASALKEPRLTAAHSTLVLEDRSSSRFIRDRWLSGIADDLLRPGPKHVTVSRARDAEATILDLSHDGYARSGVVHRRVLRLENGGHRLAGEDHLVPIAGRQAGPMPFAVRFHLHPTVQATVASDGHGIELRLANDEHWVFEAGLLPILIEESIFFAGIEGPRRTEQLVIQANSRDMGQLSWSLARLD